MTKKSLNWLFVFLWLLVIFWFSTQPSLKSDLPTLWDTIFRKIAHMSEYFVLTYFFFQAIRDYISKNKRALFASLIFGIIIASLDEFYQTFITGRTGSIIDVGIDTIGVFAFVFLSYIYSRRDKAL